MARVDVTQDVVLARIVARLQTQLDLNEQQCYETLDADSPPAVPVGGDYFLTVSPSDGEFVKGEQAPRNITENWSVTVSIFSRIHLDQTDHDAELLRDASRGLLVIKKSVLAALVGHDLTTTADGDTMLRQLLYARHTSRPAIVTRRADLGALTLAMLQINFGVDFDWDLT